MIDNHVQIKKRYNKLVPIIFQSSFISVTEKRKVDNCEKIKAKTEQMKALHAELKVFYILLWERERETRSRNVEKNLMWVTICTVHRFFFTNTFNALWKKITNNKIWTSFLTNFVFSEIRNFLGTVSWQPKEQPNFQFQYLNGLLNSWRVHPQLSFLNILSIP